MLQFGHGGEPWSDGTCGATGTAAGCWLQFGHGGEPWSDNVVIDRPKGFKKLQFGHGGEPWSDAGGGEGDPGGGQASIRPRR